MRDRIKKLVALLSVFVPTEYRVFKGADNFLTIRYEGESSRIVLIVNCNNFGIWQYRFFNSKSEDYVELNEFINELITKITNRGNE